MFRALLILGGGGVSAVCSAQRNGCSGTCRSRGEAEQGTRGREPARHRQHRKSRPAAAAPGDSQVPPPRRTPVCVSGPSVTRVGPGRAFIQLGSTVHTCNAPTVRWERAWGEPGTRTEQSRGPCRWMSVDSSAATPAP